MDVHEAIDVMCKRCTNYEVCQGTGCQPKKILVNMPVEVICKLDKQRRSHLTREAYSRSVNNHTDADMQLQLAGTYKNAERIVREVMGDV